MTSSIERSRCSPRGGLAIELYRPNFMKASSSSPAGDRVELAAAHSGDVRRGGGRTREIRRLELAVVEDPADFESASLEQPAQLVGKEQPIVGIVLDGR